MQDNPIVSFQGDDSRIPMLPTKNITQALLKAQMAITKVGKDGHNNYSGYDYTKAETMFSACRAVLNDHGLSASRIQWSYEDGPEPKVTSYLLLTHGESGDCFGAVTEYPAVPKKGTPKDKAMSASLTTSLSYWLRDLLLVPRVDAEVDHRDDRSYVPTQKSGAAVSKTTTPAKLTNSVPIDKYDPDNPQHKQKLYKRLELDGIIEEAADQFSERYTGRVMTVGGVNAAIEVFIGEIDLERTLADAKS